jgi:hypothetical protein
MTVTVHEQLFKRLVQNAEVSTLKSTLNSLLCDLAMPYNQELLQHSIECCKTFLEAVKKYRPEAEDDLHASALRFKKMVTEFTTIRLLSENGRAKNRHLSPPAMKDKPVLEGFQTELTEVEKAPGLNGVGVTVDENFVMF